MCIRGFIAVRPVSGFRFYFAESLVSGYFCPGLSDGVMVAQESLELFVMVRIHVGQPFSETFAASILFGSEFTQPEVKSREIRLNSHSTLVSIGLNRQA